MTSLSKNVKFSIEQNTNSGSFVVRSKTESFNLEHVVDKDIVSFYSELSKYGIVDTGILPLSGTGVLAIRSAGNHTQITFQHAPQISYINWGTYEGDKAAQTYLVAQPYRIWIGDTIDGNLYGARMFYSPYPISSASQPLYHLNLPNTNCRGYRGNGVGWQCLYHKDDWSNLPFNEKVVRFAERCSGVETFNDNNMSETDGPRFYKAYYSDKCSRDGLDYSSFSYLWNPEHWQNKTQQDGLEWVLNDEIWIPILVSGLDQQDRHIDGGVPLTLGMALIGNYNAYYNDAHIPKPINALTRPELSSSITAEKIASWIVRSHNSSKVAYVPVDPMAKSAKHREKIAVTPVVSNEEEEDESEEDPESVSFICPISGDPCSTHEDDVMNDSLSNVYCSGCYQENTVYCENTDSTYPMGHENVYYHEHSGEYYDVSGSVYQVCPNCNELHILPENEDITKHVYCDQDDMPVFCRSCASDYLLENYPDHKSSCYVCSTSVPINIQTNEILTKFGQIAHVVRNVYLDGSDNITEEHEHICSVCYTKNSTQQCPTGHLTFMPLAKLPVPIIHTIPASAILNLYVENGSQSKVVKITHLCGSCANPDIWQAGLTVEQIGKLSTLFSVVSQAEQRFNYSYLSKVVCDSPYVTEVSALEKPDSNSPY